MPGLRAEARESASEQKAGSGRRAELWQGKRRPREGGCWASEPGAQSLPARSPLAWAGRQVWVGEEWWLSMTCSSSLWTLLPPSQTSWLAEQQRWGRVALSSRPLFLAPVRRLGKQNRVLGTGPRPKVASLPPRLPRACSASVPTLPEDTWHLVLRMDVY